MTRLIVILIFLLFIPSAFSYDYQIFINTSTKEYLPGDRGNLTDIKVKNLGRKPIKIRGMKFIFHWDSGISTIKDYFFMPSVINPGENKTIGNLSFKVPDNEPPGMKRLETGLIFEELVEYQWTDRKTKMDPTYYALKVIKEKEKNKLGNEKQKTNLSKKKMNRTANRNETFKNLTPAKMPENEEKVKAACGPLSILFFALFTVLLVKYTLAGVLKGLR